MRIAEGPRHSIAKKFYIRTLIRLANVQRIIGAYARACQEGSTQTGSAFLVLGTGGALRAQKRYRASLSGWARL
jgi:hypothetical protein